MDNRKLVALISQALIILFRDDNPAFNLLSVNAIQDPTTLQDNIARRSLRTNELNARTYLEAKICLLARATAGGAEDSVVDGNIEYLGETIYYIANIHFEEIVLESTGFSFAAVKPHRL